MTLFSKVKLFTSFQHSTLFICLYLPVHGSVCLFIYLSLHLFIYPSIDLFIFPTIFINSLMFYNQNFYEPRLSKCQSDQKISCIEKLYGRHIRHYTFSVILLPFTTKCDFVNLSQVNEMSLTVNEFY